MSEAVKQVGGRLFRLAAATPQAARLTGRRGGKPLHDTPPSCRRIPAVRHLPPPQGLSTFSCLNQRDGQECLPYHDYVYLITARPDGSWPPLNESTKFSHVSRATFSRYFYFTLFFTYNNYPAPSNRPCVSTSTPKVIKISRNRQHPAFTIHESATTATAARNKTNTT